MHSASWIRKELFSCVSHWVPVIFKLMKLAYLNKMMKNHNFDSKFIDLGSVTDMANISNMIIIKEILQLYVFL